MGYIKTAVEFYNKAIEINPRFATAYFNRANDDSINELAIMERGIEVCRKSPDELFYLNYAKTLYNAGLYWRALDICNEGFSHFPKSGDIQYLRAETYNMVGDLVNALWDYSNAASLGNEDAIKMMNKVKGE